jgi:hypothetical protein
MEAQSSAAAGPLAQRWERWTHATHQYVLPAIAAGGLALGGALVAGAPRVLEEYVPAALVVLGAGTLGSSVLYQGWRRHVARSTAAATIPPAARGGTPPTTACPTCAETAAHREWADLVRRAWHTAVPAGLHAPALDPATGLTPGDALWQTWREAQIGRLPVELVGPVPETAWSPPEPGSFVPFPNREPTWMVVDGVLIPILPDGEIPAVVERPRELSADVSVPAESPCVSVETFVVSGPSVPSVAPSPAAEVAAFPATPEEWLTGEALHPLPPHLRGEAPTWTGPVPSIPASTVALSSITCASCARSFDEDGAWGPCPECGEPVCPGCRVRAVVDYGHTWCTTCGTGLGWETSYEPDRLAAAAAALSPWIARA